MTNWKKPDLTITNHRYIVAIFSIDYEGETEEKIEILRFDGIANRWHEKNGINRNIMMKDIKWWLPIPEIPK